MRRSKQEITDQNEIIDIISKAGTARIGLNRKGAPYIVPMNFGYDKETFYFHCAGEGLKLELLKSDPNVCIEIDESSRLQTRGKENPCSWGVNYRSIIAYGKAVFVENFEEKKSALNIIIGHLNDGVVPPMPDVNINAVTVFKLKPESLTAKSS